jgi:proteasome accessory factor B
VPRADRLFALAQLLSGPARKTLTDLATALETSPRSIYRDLAHLEQRGIAIERDGGRYRLVEPTSVRPVPLTARERLLLTLALENPGIESQPAYREPLRAVRGKLAARREKSPAVVLSGPDRSGAVPGEIVRSIEEAVAASHSVSVLYDSLSSGKKKWRGVDPWLLLHRSEAWYLVGRCHIHDEPRTYRLDRISAVLPIGQSFQRPADFDVGRWFQQSWGVEALVGSSREENEVHIHFAASVAPLIEHARHHPSESKARRSDGSLDYFVTLGPLEEIARWIVGFGGNAVALAPPFLVDRVCAIAAGAARAHVKEEKVAAMRRGKKSG